VDKQTLELLLGQGVSIERIAKRFGKNPATVGYWVKKHGLRSPYADKHAAKGGIERERLEGLVEAGMTIAEIAAEVGLSKATVRHWLGRFGLRTAGVKGKRAEQARAAKDAGLLLVRMWCDRHGEADFILEGRGYYRCKQCRVESVVRHRQKIKRTLVGEAGGSCVICGYSENARALQFHHLDPGNKRLQLSAHGITQSLAALRAEAAKCVLLCANCHAEVEAGSASVPLELSRRSEPAEPLGLPPPIHRNLG
jgi:transposase